MPHHVLYVLQRTCEAPPSSDSEKGKGDAVSGVPFCRRGRPKRCGLDGLPGVNVPGRAVLGCVRNDALNLVVDRVEVGAHRHEGPVDVLRHLGLNDVVVLLADALVHRSGTGIERLVDLQDRGCRRGPDRSQRSQSCLSEDRTCSGG